jgi:hypothetical protein
MVLGIFCTLLVVLAILFVVDLCHKIVDYEMAVTVGKYEDEIIKQKFGGMRGFYASDIAFKEGTSIWNGRIKPGEAKGGLCFMPFSVDRRSQYDWLTCQILVITKDNDRSLVPLRFRITLKGRNILRISSIRYISMGKSGP